MTGAALRHEDATKKHAVDEAETKKAAARNLDDMCERVNNELMITECALGGRLIIT